MICSFWRFPSSLRKLSVDISDLHVWILHLYFVFNNHLLTSSIDSPGHAVYRVLIGGRDQEADGRHSRLTAFIIQHPPLEGLRVVQQGALIPSMHYDLRGHEQVSIFREHEAIKIGGILKKQANREGRAAHLHLFEVADGLDGLLALYCRRRVARFQLHNGLGPSLQTLQVSFKLSQLLLLVLTRN